MQAGCDPARVQCDKDGEHRHEHSCNRQQLAPDGRCREPFLRDGSRPDAEKHTPCQAHHGIALTCCSWVKAMKIAVLPARPIIITQKLTRSRIAQAGSDAARIQQ